jgi:hypothetical protein
MPMWRNRLGCGSENVWAPAWCQKKVDVERRRPEAVLSCPEVDTASGAVRACCLALGLLGPPVDDWDEASEWRRGMLLDVASSAGENMIGRQWAIDDRVEGKSTVDAGIALM